MGLGAGSTLQVDGKLGDGACDVLVDPAVGLEPAEPVGPLQHVVDGPADLGEVQLHPGRGQLLGRAPEQLQPGEVDRGHRGRVEDEVVEAAGLRFAGAADPEFKSLFGGSVSNPSGVEPDERGAALRETVERGPTRSVRGSGESRSLAAYPAALALALIGLLALGTLRWRRIRSAEIVSSTQPASR